MPDWVEQHYQEQRTRQKGGPGSGHWGHAGRPGKRGGSVPGKGSGGVPGKGGTLAKGDGSELYRWGNLGEAVEMSYPKKIRTWSLDVSDQAWWYFAPVRLTPPTGTGKSWVDNTYGRFILDREALRKAGWSKDPSLKAEGAWRWLPRNIGVEPGWESDKRMASAYMDAIRGYEVSTVPEGGSIQSIKDILAYRLGREVPVLETNVYDMTSPFEGQRRMPWEEGY